MCIYIWSCIQLMDFDLGKDVCCIVTRPLWWDWDIKLGDVNLGINPAAYSST